jgi:acetyl esterase/lipase
MSQVVAGSNKERAMNNRIRSAVIVSALFTAATAMGAEPLPTIARRLPPLGGKLDAAAQAELKSRLAEVALRLAKHAEHPLAPDVEIFTAAVELALEFVEFYGEKDVDRAHALLAAANKRLDALDEAQTPWTNDSGLVVRGYRSRVDGSVQPYGLVIPKGLDRDKPAALYVWLHGRGDQQTNIGFLYERMTKAGQIAPDDAIVVHPFGRHCVGFKSAGEIDVLEAIADVQSKYKIDRNRIVLMGFSMGGAGAWHLGAHYADRWVALSPGAGFAETRRYQNLRDEDVPWYERKLWGVYDVPDYTRNLFNVPTVVAYSGEKDKQIQAARVMEEAFQAEGRELTHLIGPGMGHQYHPDTLAEILRRIKVARDQGRDANPRKVSLQTRTLRYHQQHWVDVRALQEHWSDARVDAELARDELLVVRTKNVAALHLQPPGWPRAMTVKIDEQTLSVTKPTVDVPMLLVRHDGRWQVGPTERNTLAKKPGLQGPIDDAFLDPFLVVLPSKTCRHEAVERWVKFEQERFLQRWRGLFRGSPRVKRDVDVTEDDVQRYHLLLWGDAKANAVIARLEDWGPIRWTDEAIDVGEKKFDARSHVPIYIYPHRENLNRYVVINSGPTFREAHDATNSQQNPKLPDWAIVDLSQPPDARTPGRITAADFFDENWQLREPRKGSETQEGSP